jgi:hypothetical protein
MVVPRPTGSRRARRRVAAVVAALSVGVAGLPAVAASAAERAASPGASSATPALSTATFAQPPTAVRPMYRYWMPLAYTEDAVLRAEVRDMAESGAGGLEVSPFVVPGAGNQTNAFLAQYGWGTPAWAHKMEVITDEAAKHGLRVDQNLGPQYPPTVPTLNSFNQPEVEQQLIFGRELNAPGSTRTGALPRPTTAPPSVTTALCRVASSGDTTIGVRSVGGFAKDDVITVGSGETAERVTVTSVGDRLAACGELGVSALDGDHAVDAAVVDVARTTRVRTVVAQCADACALGGSDPVPLVPASVEDVTDAVVDGALTHTFATGNGHPWVVIDFLQTASGLLAQRGGYTPTQPNYVVDHWSRGGVDVQTDFWDEHVLTPTVRANLARTGGAVFEDSLELGETQKWTSALADELGDRLGRDVASVLPALAGIGVQGTHAPAFELAGVGPKAREDYRQTLSDLYVEQYVKPMQAWAEGHGLDFRAQAYGTPIATAEASAAAGIPEGESLNFGSPNPLGAEQNYRVVSGGAHLGGRDLVSTECCAAFFGGYRSSTSGPSVGGGYAEGGDGSSVGGKYSQGLLDSVYKAYAGGVNQLVWHGYAYRDAPVGVGTSGRDGSWPGYHPWDIFGALNVNDEFGPRNASWPDYAPVNDALARTQLVLRQGRAVTDLGVYYEDLGLRGQAVSAQQPEQHMLGTDSATSSAGYTYEYVAPGFLLDPDVTVEKDGGLFGDRSDHHALVLNDQRTISLAGAERLLALAEQGLRLFVVGRAPESTTGADPQAGRLSGVVDELLAQRSVVRVADEAGLPAALAKVGIRPAAAPARPTAALGTVRRVAGGTTYYFVYNRSRSAVEQQLTLAGSGRPYRLDTWTGKIEPVARYTSKGGSVTTSVRVGANDAVVLAVSSGSHLGAVPTDHATSSQADVRAAGKSLVVRAEKDGRFVTKVSDGRSVTTEVKGLAAQRRLADWTLGAQTWTPGDQQWTTTKTDHAPFALTTDGDGRLPSWRELTAPVDLSRSSGLATYTAAVDLPATWKASDGAYLALGDVLDTARVTVNGTRVVVNQADRSRIDLGRTLKPGRNTIEVRVATTMFNAVRASGDSNYQTPPWQRTGLLGPVVLTPYRDVAVPARPAPPKPPKPAPAKVSSVTSAKLRAGTVRQGRRAEVRVRVSARRAVTGRVDVVVDGRLHRTVTLRQGRAEVRLSKKLRAGRHTVRVVYRGSTSVKPSRSVVRVLTVTPRRGR